MPPLFVGEPKRHPRHVLYEVSVCQALQAFELDVAEKHAARNEEISAALHAPSFWTTLV
jgi:hypothetical protein